MSIETFQMERWQSMWEHSVPYNLSESGVHPMSLRELAPPEELFDLPLGYPQTNGSDVLRETISETYKGARAEQILVTSGAAEANFLAAWAILEPGDQMVMMVPNYMQLWGVAQAFGAVVQPFHLKEQLSWAPDLDELRRLVSRKTKLIAVCNPNNPTGAVLSESDMREISTIAGSVGAWILADEVYRGAEFNGTETPSFWGLYDRLLVTGGLSKAYGLPGLRVGWLAGSADVVADLWRYKDHTSIAVSALSDHLARVALAPPTRQRILERTRQILRAQSLIFDDWTKGHGALFQWIRPCAGAFGYVRYQLELNSSELARHLREKQGVLLVPGDHFEMDYFLRIGFGGDPVLLEEGLARVSEGLKDYRPQPLPG